LNFDFVFLFYRTFLSLFNSIQGNFCDFGLVDNFVNQIADIAWSAMEVRNFLWVWVRSPEYLPSQLSYTPVIMNPLILLGFCAIQLSYFEGSFTG
jgi:hypothetical protein